MPELNKFNLSRVIPAPIKREVRQRVGFGCVICGHAFYHYEHFDPEFHLAPSHQAKGITLLCPNHHDAKNRNRISIETVRKANESPKCSEVGFSRGPLEIGNESLKIQIGNTIFIDPVNIITIDGFVILKVTKPIKNGSPFLLTFIPSNYPNSNKIIENEWFGDTSSWDITTEGNKIEVKEKKGKVILEIENILNEKLVFHKIDIEYSGYKIKTQIIKEKSIDGRLIPSQKVFRIINQKGQEISRLGNKESSFNEIKWDNALHIINNYMSSNLSGMHLKNGDFYYVHNDKNVHMADCKIESSNVNLGLAQEVVSFVNFINLLSKKPKWTILERKKLKNDYGNLSHTKLIEQLPKNEIENIKQIMNRKW